MTKKIHELSAVLTCFAYRSEYVAELPGMIATIKEHLPHWPLVIGRGPVEGFDRATFEVESPSGKHLWTFPIALNLDGSANDWVKICRMKPWWMAQVWKELGNLADPKCNRILWLDADARLHGPLDIELEPEAEVVAGGWWYDPENSDLDTITGGLLLFQGSERGPVETILERWSNICLERIENQPPSKAHWLDSDQEALTEVLESFPAPASGYTLLKLEHQKYSGSVVDDDGRLYQRQLVDHWGMSDKMKSPECRDRDWPPPEETRRQATVGTPLAKWRTTVNEPDEPR